ncbi:hypothetical protein QWY14_02145 [Planococcus sp. N028]|uniref:Uncharacterized protein n=1 Tax=Planococcus shixiaomingii TaxID=3058393 RepID=A0ABT8MY59_9BACL|nr:hypothetical protein [Planococcus sp. N028]MDN7240568.1 hypothetical protein [Planococcus sp. N028]
MPTVKQYGKMALLAANLMIIMNHGNACDRINESTEEFPSMQDPVNGGTEGMVIPPADAPVQKSEDLIPANDIGPIPRESLSERDFYVTYTHPDIQYALTQFDTIWTYYIEPIAHQTDGLDKEGRVAQLDEAYFLYSALSEYVYKEEFQEDTETAGTPDLQEFRKHFSEAFNSHMEAVTLLKEGIQVGDGTIQHEAVQSRAEKIEGHWAKSAFLMDKAFECITRYEGSLNLLAENEENWYQAFYRSNGKDGDTRFVLE